MGPFPYPFPSVVGMVIAVVVVGSNLVVGKMRSVVQDRLVAVVVVGLAVSAVVPGQSAARAPTFFRWADGAGQWPPTAC